jgi:hypothetical protein
MADRIIIRRTQPDDPLDLRGECPYCGSALAVDLTPTRGIVDVEQAPDQEPDLS